MISCSEIQAAINNSEIKISYGFKKDFTFIADEVDFNNSDFKSNLYSDRLKLTLGVIVKSHKKRPFNLKTRFKSFSNCIDIRKTNNKYLLKPNESITILTNERISINGNYSALIMPKVSLSEVGIVVTPAYIDPYYDGLLRLLVTNTSDSSFELKALEAIAQCYFFKFIQPVPEEFKEYFSQKSVFHGQNWKSIIEEDRSPFPTKKNPFSDSITGKMVYQFKNIWYFLKEYSFVSTLITFLVVLLLGFGIIKEEYHKFIDKVKNNASILENLKSDFRLNKSEIIINKGLKTGQKEIKIKIPKREIISVLCPNGLIKSTILSGESDDESVIIFSYEIPEKAKNEVKIEFEYSILRELK